MERPFERVYTVMDFWDGPRSGFADFDGVPHAYRSLWRDDLDDWDQDGQFALGPVSPDLLAIALEDWEIWRRWEEAYYADKVGLSTHPALPEDHARHIELAPIIERALEIDPSRRRIAVGEFRSLNGRRGAPGAPSSRAILEVRWLPVDDDDVRSASVRDD